VAAGSVTAAAAFFEPFLAGLASSGCSGRVRPSRSARRRSRSACASISVDEWLFTPTPIASHSAIISAFVIPSSLASSCTRMFFGKAWSAFHQRRSVGAGTDDQQFCHVGDNAFEGDPQRGERVGIDRSLPRPLETTPLGGEIEALQGAQPRSATCCSSTDASAVGTDRAPHQRVLGQDAATAEAGALRHLP
jgi:hypothetical protein